MPKIYAINPIIVLEVLNRDPISLPKIRGSGHARMKIDARPDRKGCQLACIRALKEEFHRIGRGG
jgi:hypothetical protein